MKSKLRYLEVCMNYRQIETSREIRLWIRDIIVPAAIGSAVIFSNPDARNWVKEKAQNIKYSINRKIANR